MAKKKIKSSNELYDKLHTVHKDAKEAILGIMHSLKRKKINLRYFRSEWEVELPTIFSYDRHNYAIGLQPVSIETCVGGFKVVAEDEGGDMTFTDEEINAVELVCLLSAIEDIKQIIEDPENKNDIEWDEISS